jgi:hypothetical protein
MAMDEGRTKPRELTSATFFTSKLKSPFLRIVLSLLEKLSWQNAKLSRRSLLRASHSLCSSKPLPPPYAPHKDINSPSPFCVIGPMPASRPFIRFLPWRYSSHSITQVELVPSRFQKCAPTRGDVLIIREGMCYSFFV